MQLLMRYPTVYEVSDLVQKALHLRNPVSTKYTCSMLNIYNTKVGKICVYNCQWIELI